MQIQSTTNYDQFKTLKGNRDIHVRHVNNLVKSIANKNMLQTNPIIVNSDMEVIDGQHRLEAAKANNWPVFYIVEDNATIEDVQALNSTSMNWAGEDYLLSYAKSGNSDYKKIAEVKARTGITITNLVRIFGGFYIGSNNWKNFKKGTFEIKNEEEANDFIDAYYILKSFIPRRVWNNGQFVIALKKMLDEVSIEEFLVKLNSWGQSMELRTAKKEYLRDMETIINYNNRGEYRRLSF